MSRGSWHSASSVGDLREAVMRRLARADISSRNNSSLLAKFEYRAPVE